MSEKSNDRAFVVMQVGEEGGPERRRADDVYNYIIVPALTEVGLEPYRSDLDPTPGPITPQMLRQLLEARLVIADLTGRNPNVFYELGIVHSFARRVIALAENPGRLPFDAKDERVVPLGEIGEHLGAAQADRARGELLRRLQIVLAPDYVPASPLRDVAASRRLDELAPDDPIAAELATVRGSLSQLQATVAEHLPGRPTFVYLSSDRIDQLARALENTYVESQGLPDIVAPGQRPPAQAVLNAMARRARYTSVPPEPPNEDSGHSNEENAREDQAETSGS